MTFRFHDELAYRSIKRFLQDGPKTAVILEPVLRPQYLDIENYLDQGAPFGRNFWSAHQRFNELQGNLKISLGS